MLGERYVVIGGAGLVGAAVTHALVDRGNTVTVFDSGIAAGFDYVERSGAKVVRADIGDQRLVAEIVADATSIVHLAAQTGVPQSVSDPVTDAAVNVQGSLNVLEAARAGGARRLVFASSNSVVAGHPPPAQEGLVPRPVSPYGAGKAAVEAYLAAYWAAYGLETVALRFSNVYGPWSAHKHSVVAAFVKAYRLGGPLLINGTGNQTRDFVYVDDIARGVLAALEAAPELVAGEVFQLGTGVETSLTELAERLFNVGGRRFEIERRPATAGDVARNVSDISRARAVLGYEPQVDLRSGLGRTLAWFAERFD